MCIPFQQAEQYSRHLLNKLLKSSFGVNVAEVRATVARPTDRWQLQINRNTQNEAIHKLALHCLASENAEEDDDSGENAYFEDSEAGPAAVQDRPADGHSEAESENGEGGASMDEMDEFEDVLNESLHAGLVTPPKRKKRQREE
jgi:hypothetical protein